MLLLVDCDGHYGTDLAASVFFILCVVSKSAAELPTPICAVMGLRSHANLLCLVNLALIDLGTFAESSV